jgi:peroxiredoxin
MKKIMNLCKLTVVVMACALTPALNAQMASDKMMNDTKSSSGGMMSDSMMTAAPPKVGEMASDFTLKTLDGQSVRLNELTAKSDVVLVELRGWPGYQCPLCTIQVHDFVRNAEKIKATGVQVVMVYPGPAEDLKAHATEFLSDKSWPEGYLFVLDPDFSVTKAYGLRWDAPGETAYPSTFIINKDGKVTYAHISKEHGNRVISDTVLKMLHHMM